jgi:trigger factor
MKKTNKVLAKKQKQRARQKATAGKILMIAGITVLVAAVACAIILPTIYDFNTALSWTLKSERSNYSAYINDDGTIKDVNINDYVTLCDYSQINLNKSELTPTEDDIDEAVKDAMDGAEELDKTAGAEVADGDKVNIDYVGTAEGEEFENTDGKGTDLTIGSDSYVAGFEDQLIGQKVGSTVTVTVTFPDDYANKPELAGKPASFQVTINGIYKDAELTDAYVKEHFSDQASTAAEYRAYWGAEIYKNNIKTAIADYLTANCTVSSFPAAYFNHLKNRIREQYESQYNYYNSSYYSSLGYYPWSSVYNFLSMTKDQYEQTIVDQASDEARYYMIIEAIYLKENLTLTRTEMVNYWAQDGTTSTYDQLVEQYGRGYTARIGMTGKVIDLLTQHVVTE